MCAPGPFGISINKDVVRRILATHYHPSADGRGPSWLTFIGQAKDSLHSIDLFRCESVTLRTYWVLIVMDQYTRRIIGIHAGDRRWPGTMPDVQSSDSRPGVAEISQFRPRSPISVPSMASQPERVLGVKEIKTIPYVPLSQA